MSPTEDIDESTEEKETPSQEMQEWLSRVQDREKFFHDHWWKQADNAYRLYCQEKEDPRNPYNVLYANTEVLKPSLYSATPKPDVRNRFTDTPSSPLTKLAENFLIIFSDPSNPGYEDLDKAMSDAVASALVPGMGFIRLRHHPERAMPLCPESGHFKGLIWPQGKKWSRLPWICFRHEMTREEIFSQFKIKGEAQNKLSGAKKDSEYSSSDENENDKACLTQIVYEVWIKNEKRILFLCAEWEDILLEDSKDVLSLQGFYPTPGPLTLVSKPSSLTPTSLYEYYRNQAEELNRVTARLNKVLQAIKVRGAYNTLLGDELKQLLEDSATENALIPAQEGALMSQTGGFDRQIWFLPIEKLIEVATQLYTARESIKQVIYELTGLSDIIRGSSVASETATAQNLKNKWGSIRIRDMQKAVSSYVRDLYRLAIDAASQVVPAEQWKAITQSPLLTEQEKQLAFAKLQQAQQMGLPIPPEQIQQIQQQASQPTVDSLVSQLNSDANRTFTINVQADSTIDLDTATDKAEVGEFMNAMGQMLAGLQPLAALGPSGLQVAKEMVIAVCRRFKFGLTVVDSLQMLQPPPPQQTGPTPEQQKAQKDLEKQQADLKKILTQIEDEKRDLEVQRKEFDADVKVFRSEQAAHEKVVAANLQAQQASAQAKSAQDESIHVQRKAEISSANAGLRATQKATQSVQQVVNPAVETLAKTVQQLQSKVEELQTQVNKPRRAVKDANGNWISTVG